MIRREISIFLIVGTLGVVIDFFTYRALVWTNRVWTFGQKPHAAGSVWRFIFLYTITLSANILVNSVLISWLPNQLPVLLDLLMMGTKLIMETTLIMFNQMIYEEINIILIKLLNKEFTIQIAFLVATVTSAALNFIGMKFFVFKTRSIRI